VALSWLIDKKVVVLIGARNIEQLKENIESVDVVLTME
jgi:Predicted oxidoreductases (related to aryl-alcohol dehydrogenases)